MIYAKSYTTVPALLILFCGIFIPGGADRTVDMSFLSSEILLLIGLLLYVFGIYLFVRATYHILQQYMGEKKGWFKLLLLICLVVFDYGWLVLLV